GRRAYHGAMARDRGAQAFLEDAMADRGKGADAARAQWTQATPAGYMPGFGNDFETEALPGALPVGQNSPQRTAYGLLRRAAVGLALHRPAWHQRALLALPHPSVGAARAEVQEDVAATLEDGAITWRARPPDRPVALGPRAGAEGEAHVSLGHAHHDDGRRRQHPDWHGGPCLSHHPIAGARLFLQRRRRDAARTAAGQSALLHRVRPDRGRPGRDLHHPARGQMQG